MAHQERETTTTLGIIRRNNRNASSLMYTVNRRQEDQGDNAQSTRWKRCRVIEVRLNDKKISKQRSVVGIVRQWEQSLLEYTVGSAAVIITITKSNGKAHFS
jgi:hypothetical protein